MKNQLLKWWDCLSPLNWIRALRLSLLLKLPARKLEPWFFLWSFLLLMLVFISLNVACSPDWAGDWAGASYCNVDILDKLQKQAFGPTRDVCLEP